jgi:hypothetical protein
MVTFATFESGLMSTSLAVGPRAGVDPVVEGERAAAVL